MRRGWRPRPMPSSSTSSRTWAARSGRHRPSARGGRSRTSSVTSSVPQRALRRCGSRFASRSGGSGIVRSSTATRWTPTTRSRSRITGHCPRPSGWPPCVRSRHPRCGVGCGSPPPCAGSADQWPPAVRDVRAGRGGRAPRAGRGGVLPFRVRSCRGQRLAGGAGALLTSLSLGRPRRRGERPVRGRCVGRTRCATGPRARRRGPRPATGARGVDHRQSAGRAPGVPP